MLISRSQKSWQIGQTTGMSASSIVRRSSISISHSGQLYTYKGIDDFSKSGGRTINGQHNVGMQS